MSFSGSKGKQYGLIMSARKTASKPLAKLKASVFGDSSSEEEDGKRHINVALRREHEKRAKQTHQAAARALEEDPTIFEYDTLYEQMTEQKKKQTTSKLQPKDRKPKYIHALKKAAEKRKIESEIVYEHMAQKELENEEEQFQDKESFVTSAYKKKLEERKKLEEELARETAFDEANDVRKQKDLSRFQKHLFQQIVSPNSAGEGSKEKEEERGMQRSVKLSVIKGGRWEKEDSRGGKEERRRRESGDRDSEKRRSFEATHDQTRFDEQRTRERTSDEKEEEKGFDNRRRIESEPENQSTRLSRTESESDEMTPSPLPPSEPHPPEPKHPLSQSSSSPPLPAPPPKRTKLAAGIEVEVEDEDPQERRRQAAAKRSTNNSVMSAKERYLARKRAKLDSETDTQKHQD